MAGTRVSIGWVAKVGLCFATPNLGVRIRARFLWGYFGSESQPVLGLLLVSVALGIHMNVNRAYYYSGMMKFIAKAKSAGCTVVARNYIPRATILAEGFRASHPDLLFYVLVLDPTDSEYGDDLPFTVLTRDDLPISPAKWDLMGLIYNVTEFATAVKPWLLEALLRYHDIAVYLDPDIQIFAPLEELDRLELDADVLLTPHVLDEVPRDDRSPSEADILRSGVYNLGFLALNQAAVPLLHWWQDRTYLDAVIDPANMVFTDQRWMDFAPSIARCGIIRNEGYNVAYWNLHSRILSRSMDQWFVNGKPLVFFHYSGYSHEKPHLVSKHQGGTPRILLSERPDLTDLFSGYGELLAKIDISQEVGYGYQKLPSGMVIDRTIQTLVRSHFKYAPEYEMPLALDEVPAFTEEGEITLVNWLNSPVQHRGYQDSISRYLMGIYALRPDVQAAFPNPNGHDKESYLSWVLTNGGLEMDLPAALLPTPAPSLENIKGRRSQYNMITPTPFASTDVQIIGYLNSELGIGAAARHLLAACQATGVVTHSFVFGATQSQQSERVKHAPAPHPIGTNIVCINADQLELFARRYPKVLKSANKNIGVWFWELNEFPPPLAASAKHLDEIWVASEFIASGLRKVVDKPVKVYPHPIVTDAGSLPVLRPSINSDFQFLFSFDYLSVFERKNPIGVVSAFRNAFSNNEGPRLVIKTINGTLKPLDQEKLRQSLESRSDISLVEHYLSGAEQDELFADSSCYISLHRSEGLGLTMAEAMAHGKPVIATAYSGNLEFMNDNTSLLVPYSLTNVGPGNDPYSASAIWADPIIEDASSKMRLVWENPELCLSLGMRAQNHVRTSHSLSRTADFIKSELSTFVPATDAGPTGTAVVWQAPSDNDFTSSLERVITRLRSGPDVQAKGNLGPISRVVRRLFLRLGDNKFSHDRETLLALAALVQHQQEVIQENIAHGNAASFRETLSNNAASLRTDMSTLREVAMAQGRSLQELYSTLQNVITFHSSGTIDGGPRGLTTGSSSINEQALNFASYIGLLEARLHKAESDVATASAVVGELNESTNKTELKLAYLREVVDRTESTLFELGQELTMPPYMADASAISLASENGSRVIGFDRSLNSTTDPHDEGDLGKGLYINFEDMFRGTEEMIQERNSYYIPLLPQHGKIVDLGCGRGEMLDTLRQHDRQAIGVDLDPDMVRRSRSRGLAVTQANALDWLREQPARSLAVVFSSQFVEHIDPTDLPELFDLARQVLTPGGLFIAETVNPGSIRAFRTFWVDISHRVPLHPEVLLSLARSTGYLKGQIIFPFHNGDYEQQRVLAGEYALIAEA